MRSSRQQGGALLAVLWLSAGLAAIAFSIATTVRGETERTGTAVDSLKARYLALGAVDRAILYMQWGPSHRHPDGSPMYYEPGMAAIEMEFPTGVARADIVPEYAKLDINRITGENLVRLLANLGLDAANAEQLAEAILDWRTPAPGGFSRFDHYYLSLAPSFRARHASLEEIEELLLVKGMTPELFHGGYTRDPEGRLVERGGLKNCVSVYGSNEALDVNHVEPAVLATIGVSPAVIPALVERRRARPFRTTQDLNEFAQWGGPGFSRLQIGGGSIFTIRATATLRLADGRLSDVRRSAAAMVKFRPEGKQPPYEILRWQEN
jgi:general secretion pathway protein K